MPISIPRTLYFSGQGLVWAAKLTNEGEPMGFRPLGNVTSLVLEASTRTFGRRRHLVGGNHTVIEQTTGLSGKLTANIENLMLENAAMLAGDTVDLIPARNNFSYSFWGYLGAYSNLPFIGITNVDSISLNGVTALTPYTAAGVAHDYRLDARSGLLFINDGIREDVVGLKVGAPTVSGYAVSNGFLRLFTSTYAEEGDIGLLMNPGPNLTGNQAYLFKVRGSSDFHIDTDIQVPSGVPALGVGTSVRFDRFNIQAQFDTPDQIVAPGLARAPEKWAFLFQGINTVDGELSDILVPHSFIRNKYTRDAINNQLSTFSLEATMLGDMRDSASTLFEITSRPQGIPAVLTGFNEQNLGYN